MTTSMTQPPKSRPIGNRARIGKRHRRHKDHRTSRAPTPTSLLWPHRTTPTNTHQRKERTPRKKNEPLTRIETKLLRRSQPFIKLKGNFSLRSGKTKTASGTYTNQSPKQHNHGLARTLRSKATRHESRWKHTTKQSQPLPHDMSTLQ